MPIVAQPPAGNEPDDLDISLVAPGAQRPWQYGWERRLAGQPQEKNRLLWRWLSLIPSSDADAARIIRLASRDELNFTAGPRTWHQWDGTCHRPDTSGSVGHAVGRVIERWAELIRAVPELAGDCIAFAETQGASASDLLKERGFEEKVKYVARLASSAGLKSLMEMLAVKCSVDASVFDERNPGWLNVPEGTIELRSGTLRPHDPADMIAYCLDTPYRPGELCPQFQALVHSVAGGDPEVIEFLWRVMGYSLLGSNPEQVMVFINGPTSSGKSQLLHIMAEVIGTPLAHRSKAELITLVRHGRNARTMNSIRGARLITITETSAFMVIDEGQVKQLTGEAVISVDQHYAKAELKTPVTWLIVIATNKMPSLTDFDAAMARRVLVIPGGPTVPEEQRDTHLADRILATEREGILAGLAEACAAYHREGLPVPSAVREETARYRRQQDTVGNFLAECARIVPSRMTPNGLLEAEVGMTQAWALYQRWARGEMHLTRNEFYDQLASQPGVVRVDRSNSRRVFTGLSWSPQGESLLSGGGQDSR